MTTFANGESGLSVRTKINNVLQHADGTAGELVINEAGADVDFRVESDTNANALFVDGATGNVGIGTSSPYSRFTVVPASNPVTPTAANQITIGEASGNAAYAMHVGYFLESGAYKGSIQATSGAAPSTLVLNGDGGNVGIGTSSPGARLHSSSADGGAYSFGLNGTTKGLRVIHNSTGTAIQGVDATLSATYEPLSIGGSYTTITTSSLERLRIDASGNLLVGRTTVPVQNTAGAGITPNGLIITESAQTQGGLWVNRITSDGNAIYFTRQNVEVGSISVTSSATSYNTSSDYRLKEDLRPIEDALSRLAALNPVNFAWKADGTRTDGFIAHEVQAVAPQAVTGEKDGEAMQAIDHSKLVPLLTAALQEALAKIATLETRISALEA